LCFLSPRIVEDNDEWGGSSLSSAMQEKIKDKDKHVHCCLLPWFHKKKQKMTTNVAFIVIFCRNLIRTIEDKNKCNLVIVFFAREQG
jgi:hypothetical protein